MRNIIYKVENKKKLLAFVLFVAAFAERVFFDLGPNIELVTMAMLLSAYYIGSKESFRLTLAIMVTSDLIIGNSNIFIFTWTGFLIPIFLASKILTTLKSIKMAKILPLTSIGFVANFFFYLWTNFGVWLLGSMYPRTTTGLIMSYINGLPFLRYQLISTLIFVPIGVIVIEKFLNLSKNWKSDKNFLLSI